ncbi:hypothetical protein QL285_052602 [Trifolium repens]|nr:hypothetical protein QL285_052602 [Trifolium repens]
MVSFNIPWKCLDLSNEPQNKIIEPAKPQKSFVQALTNLCDIPISQLPQPVVKGERLAIEIPEVAYEAGLDACKHNLHGWILWPKGSTPLSVVALKAKLSLIWKDFSRWGVISLGKGFFEFNFSTLEDVKRVRSTPSWNLNPGLLKLFAWTRDFNPKLQHNTSVQVWVKIFGLSQEYWNKTILFTIAGSIGTPICMDSASAKPMHERTFGQFARILVDIDLLQPLRYKLLVERKGFAFFVDLEYEHIPAFCDGCKVIGHYFENCKRWNKDDSMRNENTQYVKKTTPVEPKQIFVPTNDRRNNQSKDKETANVETEIINVEDSSSKSPQVLLGSNNKKDGESSSKNLHISPTIQVDKRHLDVAILTPVSPRSLLREQDKQIEKELNDDFDENNANTIILEENSSQDSFVNDTQPVEVAGQSVISGQPPQEDRPNQPVDIVKVPTPERVAKDMVFLKESWANMAEADEELQKKLEDTGQMVAIHDDGFQIQLSKGQKKAQKKLKQSSRDSYGTRSKGVSPKPFR